MFGAGGTYEENKIKTEIWWENLKECNYFEYLGIGESMILK
jgi:hypothetical protein